MLQSAMSPEISNSSQDLIMDGDTQLSILKFGITSNLELETSSLVGCNSLSGGNTILKLPPSTSRIVDPKLELLLSSNILHSHTVEASA